MSVEQSENMFCAIGRNKNPFVSMQKGKKVYFDMAPDATVAARIAACTPREAALKSKSAPHCYILDQPAGRLHVFSAWDRVLKQSERNSYTDRLQISSKRDVKKEGYKNIMLRLDPFCERDRVLLWTEMQDLVCGKEETLRS